MPQPSDPSEGAGRRNPPGGKSSLILGWDHLFFCCFFSFERFFYFLKINTPTTLFLLINLVTFPPSPTSHALTLSRPRTPASSPSTLKPFVLILFCIKRRKLLTKALYVSLSLFPPPPFHFSPSCSASRLLGKAWRLACPSFFPVVNGKGKNNKKDLMRGFLNTIKIDINLLWKILSFFM